MDIDKIMDLVKFYLSLAQQRLEVAAPIPNSYHKGLLEGKIDAYQIILDNLEVLKC